MPEIARLPWAWITIFAVAAGDAIWLHIDGLSVSPHAILAVACFSGLMMLLSVFYTRLRPDERLALLTERAAQLAVYSVSLGIAGYLAVSLRYPLIDLQLDAADRALGFDWLAVYHWVAAHFIVRVTLIAAYDSVVVQIALLTVLLISLRRYDRARSLLWLYIITSLCYTAIAAFWPAAGAFGFYHVAFDTPYVQQFFALREGASKTLELFRMQGVVQFLSFHLTLAVLCAYAVRGIRFWFPAITVLNLLVIAATPAIGGHYLADLWSSLLLTAALIFITERLLKLCPPVPSNAR